MFLSTIGFYIGPSQMPAARAAQPLAAGICVGPKKAYDPQKSCYCYIIIHFKLIRNLNMYLKHIFQTIIYTTKDVIV